MNTRIYNARILTMGVLAGDGLLNYAYETALKAFDMEPTNANIAKATRVLAAKSGIYGMVGGQTIDVRNEGKPITIELLRVMYEWKTGALIEAAMKISRHAKIIELISASHIETQEELAEKLNNEGFSVTQATISRDIRELRLTKMSEPGGRQYYAVVQGHGFSDCYI